MNHIYIGDRQLEPDDEPDDLVVSCWNCSRVFDGASIKRNDGDCPGCNAEIFQGDDPGEPNEDPE